MDACRSAPAAVLYEPVQTGAGVRVFPPGFGSAVAGLAREWGALLIAEEVTTGVGRTGHWTGCDRQRLLPDLIVLGKALGNGLPVAAVATAAAVEAAAGGRWRHVQSHQNDPWSGAVAHTVITTIAQEGLLERVRENGLLLLGLLQALAATRPRAQTARGVGLMAALELSPGVDGESVRDCARAQGILIDYHVCSHSLRMFPPYVIRGPELEQAAGVLDQVLNP